jgi:hypothetical protein
VDPPYPAKGDAEGWRTWWTRHCAAWSDYWSATGQDPAAGIFGDGETEDCYSLEVLEALSPPDYAARLKELSADERARIRRSMGIPDPFGDEHMARFLRSVEESPDVAALIAKALRQASEGGAE